MAKFAYNNMKITSTSHISLELNYSFYPQVSYKEDVDYCSQLNMATKLAIEFKELIIICRENLQYV